MLEQSAKALKMNLLRQTLLYKNLATFLLMFVITVAPSHADETVIASFLEPPEVTTIAGTGRVGNQDGAASVATFMAPTAVAVDLRNDAIIVADSAGERIRRIDRSGNVSTIAGTGKYIAGGLLIQPGFLDGPVTQAKFSNPSGVAVDTDGSIIVADTGNFCIRRISNGTVTTIAGQPGHTGNLNGPSEHALFSRPRGIAVGADRTIYVADGENGIRSISNGLVNTLPIPHDPSMNVSNLAISDQTSNPVMLWYSTPDGIGSFNLTAMAKEAFDAELPGGDGIAAIKYNEAVVSLPKRGAIYFSDQGSVERLVAGNPTRYESGDGSFKDGSTRDSRFYDPAGLAVDSSGRVIVADRGNHRIRKLPLINSRTFVGSVTPSKGPDEYRIAYLSNSFAYYDVTWDDSVEGQLESYLNKNRQALGIPHHVHVDAIRYGSLGIKPQAQYIRELLGDGQVDLVIWSVNSHAFRDDFENYIFTLPPLDAEHISAWKSEIKNTYDHLSQSGTKLLLFCQPFGVQVGPGEDFYLKESTALVAPQFQQTLRDPNFGYEFNLELEGALSQMGVPFYPTYEKFIAYENRAHAPLYISEDFHWAPRGDAFYASLVIDALKTAKPWQR